MQSVKRGKGWILAGWVALVAAFVGILIPIVPQVPFAVLAAYFFSKGSPRLHHWLLNHRQLGPSLRDWEMDHVIRWRAKILSSLMMFGGAAIAYWKFHEDRPEWSIGIGVLFAAAIIFVLTRRSKSRLKDESRDEFRFATRE